MISWPAWRCPRRRRKTNKKNTLIENNTLIIFKCKKRKRKHNKENTSTREAQRNIEYRQTPE